MVATYRPNATFLLWSLSMHPEQGLFSLHIHHAPEWTSVSHILCTPAVAQWWGEVTRNDHRRTLAEPASRAGLPPLPTTLANDSRKARGLSFCNLSHSLPAWPQPTPRRSPPTLLPALPASLGAENQVTPHFHGSSSWPLWGGDGRAGRYWGPWWV